VQYLDKDFYLGALGSFDHDFTHIYHQTNVTRKKKKINKRCTKMGGSKNTKEPIEKKVLYIISKDQSLKNG